MEDFDIASLPPKISEIVSELSKKITFDGMNWKGGNGYVLIGDHNILSRRVVVKFYYWGDGAHAEPKLLSALEHDHVLAVHDAASIDEEDAYFMTSYCANGDLDDVMAGGSVGVKRAIDLMIELASGVNFIHSKGYIHRDLKPSNIFCDGNGRMVIGDFGSVVKNTSSGYVQTFSKHSLIYRTPEEVASQKAYPQGDVYQMGIVLYQLLGGMLPYFERDWLNSRQQKAYDGMSSPDNQLYATGIIEAKISKGTLLNLKSLPPWCPRELVNIIRSCCRTNVSDRVNSAAALLARLNNLRASVPDWRLDPEPTLYRPKAKFRVQEQGGKFLVQKMVKAASAWRTDRGLKPTTNLAKAIAHAESL